MTFHIVGILSSQLLLTHIFQRGRSTTNQMIFPLKPPFIGVSSQSRLISGRYKNCGENLRTAAGNVRKQKLVDSVVIAVESLRIL